MGRRDVEAQAIDCIRFLATDAIERANSGHPGLPMGAAAMAYVLWTRHLRHNPTNPAWPNRDRFVLSAGHGSMLLYALLHLTGYDLSLDDQRFLMVARPQQTVEDQTIVIVTHWFDELRAKTAGR